MPDNWLYADRSAVQGLRFTLTKRADDLFDRTKGDTDITTWGINRRKAIRSLRAHILYVLDHLNTMVDDPEWDMSYADFTRVSHALGGVRDALVGLDSAAFQRQLRREAAADRRRNGL